MTQPRCTLFGECGGCDYQDLSYQEELSLKTETLRTLLEERLALSSDKLASLLKPTVASPQEYHTRSRLDLTLQKKGPDRFHLGFFARDGYAVLDVSECPIARQEISTAIPLIKEQSLALLPAKYRRATITVKTDEQGRLDWGGIGKGSLKRSPEDYLSITIHNRRIHYSLDTFFQANLFILPELMANIEQLSFWHNRPVFYDLYSGVGLFGLSLSHLACEVILIEDNKTSHRLAEHNISFNQLTHVRAYRGAVEEVFPQVFNPDHTAPIVAMIDPPRKGLDARTLEFLCNPTPIQHLLYLSCSPESLARDLAALTGQQWRIELIQGYDFFPKTKHIETLVLLSNSQIPLKERD